jgi:phospholipase C
MTNGSGLGSVNHVVVLMLENRSFDHMLGFLYSGQQNVSPAGQHPAADALGREDSGAAYENYIRNYRTLEGRAQ